MAKAPPSVDDLMDGLDHPRRAEIEAVRGLVLGAGKRVSEGVKWNAPSFRSDGPDGDWFATVNLRSRDSVQLIFHRGAKVKAAVDMEIPDPKGLLKRLDANRVMVTLGKGAAFKANAKPFTAIVKAWLAYV